METSSGIYADTAVFPYRCNAMDISSTEADAAQQNEEPIQTQEEAQADSAHASLTVHYLM